MVLARQAGTGDRLYAKLTGSHIPGLDGIRAMAVSAVILGHLPNTHGPAAQGVSTFFVLSGFLITWLLLEEKQRTGRISIRLFYIRRALRLPAF
jgi:peptidoglycan/LPS O-acetylase OafA/YrhL